MTTNEIITVEKPEEKALTKITNYMESAVVRARFAKILGDRNAEAYISSVLITVANSKTLQGCTAISIYTSALRAATLRLSVDGSTGQAYLVAYNGQATLIPGYKGLYDMAIRTNRYRYINVGKIYEGQEVLEDQITGFHKLNGLRNGDNHIGWIGAFEMLPRFGQYSKTIYMSVEEIHQHAQKYSKGYGTPNKDGVLVDKWNKPTIWHTEKEKMEKKTVLRLLLRRWAYLDPSDAQMLDDIEEAQEIETIDAINAMAETSETHGPEIHNSKAANLAAITGDNPDPVKDATWADWQAWQKRAEAVKIILSDVKRGGTTESDLRGYLAEIAPGIIDAERQDADEPQPELPL